MSAVDRDVMTDVFRAMCRSSRPPEPETPVIYADHMGWDPQEVESCLIEARRLEAAGAPPSPRMLAAHETVRAARSSRPTGL